MVLAKLGLIGLFQDLYDGITIPSAVAHEVVTRGLQMGQPDAWSVQQAISLGYIKVVETKAEELPQDIAELPLDVGEKQVLFLGHRDNVDLVLFDEAKARQEAMKRGLSVRGTLGVLVQAYRAGRLTREQLQFALNEIMARDDIWISAELCRRVIEGLLD